MVLNAKSDDTNSLKGVELNWISSRDISSNLPVALARNANRRRRDRSMLASKTVQVRLLSSLIYLTIGDRLFWFAGWVSQ
jgi:hypothetical protein